MSFPDYFLCKLPKTRFSTDIHFKPSLSEILFYCKKPLGNVLGKSTSVYKQCELFLKFWNTYHHLLGHISYLKQLVFVGNYLVDNDFPYFALHICFSRYLKSSELIQLSTFSLNLAAFGNIDHNDELFEFTLCAIFGLIKSSFLVLTSTESSISIQNLLSSFREMLLNLQHISQIFIKFDRLFWLSFNSTVLIYSISLKLILLKESHVVLPFLYWSIMLLESYSSAFTPYYIDLRNVLYITICYVYDICHMSRDAEEFARMSLEKVQEDVTISVLEQSQFDYSSSCSKQTSIHLLSVVFCYNVFNMRLKARTVLKPKSRISLNDALQLDWPRSNTERLLSELMKQGVSSYFFAILYTLISNAHIKQDTSPNSKVYLNFDSEILFEIYSEIFQAGAFILMNTFNYIDFKFRGTFSVNTSKYFKDDNGTEIPNSALFRDSFPLDFQCVSLNHAFLFITLSFYFNQQDVFILIANRFLFVSELLQDSSNYLYQLTVKLLILFNSFIKSLTIVRKDNIPDEKFMFYLKEISILMANYTSLKLNPQVGRILVDMVFTLWWYLSKYLSTITCYKRAVDFRTISFQDFSNIMDNLTNFIIDIHFIKIDPIIFLVVVIKRILLKECLCYTSNFQNPKCFEVLVDCQNILKMTIHQISLLMDVLSVRIQSLKLFKYFVENLFFEIVCLYIRISIRLTLIFNFQGYYIFTHSWSDTSSSFLRTHFPTLVPLYNTLSSDHLLSYLFNIQFITVLNENQNNLNTKKFIEGFSDTLPLFDIKSDTFIHIPTLTNLCHLLKTPPTICCHALNTICTPPMFDVNIEENDLNIYWWALFVKDFNEARQIVTKPLSGFKRLSFLIPYGETMFLNTSIIQPGLYLFAVAYFDHFGDQLGCLSRSTKPIRIRFNLSHRLIFEKLFILLSPNSSETFISKCLNLLWPHLLGIQMDKQSLDSITYPIKEQNIYLYSVPVLSKIVCAMLIELALPFFHSDKSLLLLCRRNTVRISNSMIAIKLFSLHKLVLVLNDSDIIYKYFLLTFTFIIPFLQNCNLPTSFFPSLIIILNSTLECFTPLRTICYNESRFKLLISFSYSFIKKFDVIGEHKLAKYFFEFISQCFSQISTDSSYTAHPNSNIPDCLVPVQILQRDLTSRSKSRSSAHCPGNAVSSMKSKFKKQKNSIPTQIVKEKCDYLLAFETFFFFLNSFSSLDSLEITGIEDPFVLNLLIASLPPTLAYKEVCKFRRRSKYIEYITKLCIKTYISGNLGLILAWSEEVFNWLQKRNEVLLTKVPLINIQRDKVAHSSMDYVLSNNFLKDSIKDESNQPNAPNLNLSNNPLTEDKKILRGNNKIFNNDKRGHIIRKATNRLTRLQVRKDDVYNKARDILATLLPSLWKSHCKRKRIRKITFSELPWRIELFNILSATRFELLLVCLKQNSHIHKDISISHYFTYSSPKRHFNIINGRMLVSANGGCGGVFLVGDSINVNLSNYDIINKSFDGSTFPNVFAFNLQNTTPIPAQQFNNVYDKKSFSTTHLMANPNFGPCVSDILYESCSKSTNANPQNKIDDSAHLMVNLSHELNTHLHLIYYFLKKAIILSDRSDNFLLGYNSCKILNNVTQTLIGYLSKLNIVSSSLLSLVISEARLPYFLAACSLIKMIHNTMLETSTVLNLNTIRSIIYTAIGVLYYTKQWKKLINIIVHFNSVSNFYQSSDLIPILIFSHFQINLHSEFNIDYYLIKLSKQLARMPIASSMYFYSRQIYQQFYCGLNLPPIFPGKFSILNPDSFTNTQEMTRDFFQKLDNVQIYPFSKIPISKLTAIYEKTILELQKNDELSQLCIACFELANLYFIEGKEHLAFYHWSLSLDSFLGFQDMIGKWTSNNNMLTHILSRFDKCPKTINILYAITICATIGEKFLFSSLNFQIEYCLLAAHLHCLLFISFLADPFQFHSYLNYSLLEEDVATFFPNLEISNDSSVDSIDISLILYSLNWLACTLFQSGFYWHTLPILMVYEFIAVKIACSIIHTVLCTLCKIDVLVKLHLFKEALFEFFFFFEGKKTLYKPHSNVSFNRCLMSDKSFSNLLTIEHSSNLNVLFHFAKMNIPLIDDPFLYPLISNLIVFSKVKFFCEIISGYQSDVDVVSSHDNFTETHRSDVRFSVERFENSDSMLIFHDFIDMLNSMVKDFDACDIKDAMFSIIEHLLCCVLKQLINSSIRLRLYFLIEIEVLYGKLNQLRNGTYIAINNFLVALNSLSIFNNLSEPNHIEGLFLVFHSPKLWNNLIYLILYSLVIHLTDKNHVFPPFFSTYSLLNRLRYFAQEVFDWSAYAKFTLLTAQTTLILHQPRFETIGIIHECMSILNCTYSSIETFQIFLLALIFLGDIFETTQRANIYVQALERLLDFIHTFQDSNKVYFLYNPNFNMLSLLLNRLGSAIFSPLRSARLSTLFFKHSMISHNSSFYSNRFTYDHSYIHKFVIDIKLSDFSTNFTEYVKFIYSIFNDICTTPLLEIGLTAIIDFLIHLLESPVSELNIRAQLKEKCLILIKAYIGIENSIKKLYITPEKIFSNDAILQHPLVFNFITYPFHCFEKNKPSMLTFEILYKKSINLAKQPTQCFHIDVELLFRSYQILLHLSLLKPSKLLAYNHILEKHTIWITQLISLHSYFLMNDLSFFGYDLKLNLSSLFAFLSYAEIFLSKYMFSPNTNLETITLSEQSVSNTNYQPFGNSNFTEYECCFIWKLPVIDGSVSCIYALCGKQSKSSENGELPILIGHFSCDIDIIHEIHEKLKKLFFKCDGDNNLSSFRKKSTNNLTQSLSCENSKVFKNIALNFLQLLSKENSHLKSLEPNILSLELLKELTDVSRSHIFQSISLYLCIESNISA